MTPLARLSLLVVALLVSGFSFGVAPVQAAELPVDTNKIERLTPEQARKLAKEFPGVEVEMEMGEGIKQKVRACLPMNGLKSLDAKTAKALAGYDKGPLWLSGMTSLDAATAKGLAEFEGNVLYLDGLTTLDADTAKSLAGFKGDVLALHGLTTLDADTAKALGGFKRTVAIPLNVLEAFVAKNPLTPETALAWAVMFNGHVSLTALDADTAKALAAYKGQVLSLDGLTTLDAATAKALAEFKGAALELDSLTTLDAATAKALAEFKGEALSLDDLTTLDAETAKALAAAKKWDGELWSITALDTSDSVAVAQSLATRKGPLELPNLQKISPKTLMALIEKRDVEIPLIETLELISEPDGSPTDDFVIPKWLEKREKERRRAGEAAE